MAAGEAVRWQNAPRGRWHHGTITRRERDGSVGVRGEGGDARSLPVERLEVRRAGARNAWEPLAVRAARAEQLRLEL